MTSPSHICIAVQSEKLVGACSVFRVNEAVGLQHGAGADASMRVITVEKEYSVKMDNDYNCYRCSRREATGEATHSRLPDVVGLFAPGVEFILSHHDVVV